MKKFKKWYHNLSIEGRDFLWLILGVIIGTIVGNIILYFLLYN